MRFSNKKYLITVITLLLSLNNVYAVGVQGPEGPPGAKGPTGPRGDRGIQGLQGQTGPVGAKGPSGPRGERGIQGLQGQTGPVGAKGPTGPVGERGPAGASQGPQGIQGPKGDTGATGPQGPQGVQGPIGLTGPQGIQGPQGDKGDIGPQGIQGLTGPAGADSTVPGPQGPTGPRGPAGLSQAGVNVGDMQYWDGTQWQVVPVIQPDPNIKPTLALCEGVPTWVLYYCPGTSPYTIGETGPAGGKVFYVTDGGLHGLEAAPVDQTIGAVWGCYGTSISGAQGTAIGTGAANTAAIVNGCGEANTAAKIADNYTFNGFTDWFLPSKDELNLLYLQKDVVGGFANTFYWSSSEFNTYFAWFQSFGSGDQGSYGGGKDGAFPVRAVRAF